MATHYRQYASLPRAALHEDPELLWKMKSHAIFLAYTTGTTYVISYDGNVVCTIGPRSDESTHVILIRTEVEVPEEIAVCV